MSICRICYSSPANKDIKQLKSDADGSPQNGTFIYDFCLNIQIEADLNLNSNLCLTCFEKVLSFYEFKCLALKNNGYDVGENFVSTVKVEVVLEEDVKDEHQASPEGWGTVPSTTVKIEATDEGDPTKNFQPVIKQERQDSNSEEEEHEESVVPIEVHWDNNAIQPQQSTKPKDKRTRVPEVCKDCGKTVTKMRIHRLLHLPLEERKKFECDDCGKMFLSDSAKVRHHKIKHLGMMEKCPTCDKVVANLRQHELVMHNSALLRFACTMCDRRFRGQALLDEHMGTHSNERLFQCKCDVCDKNFVNKYVLMKHKQQVHEKVKSHVCGYCQKSFFEKSNLKLHLRTHTKEKPYECNECGKRWGNTNLLKKHLVTHTDLRKYPCTMCDKIYKRPDRLRQHMAKHVELQTQQPLQQPPEREPMETNHEEPNSIVIEIPNVPTHAS